MPDLTKRPSIPVQHANEVEHRRIIAERANIGLPMDGSLGMSNPLQLKDYTVTSVPTASEWQYGMILVSDETGGAIPAFSDGTNWRRVSDRAIVS